MEGMVLVLVAGDGIRTEIPEKCPLLEVYDV